jgi:Icc-related predicted phosphoesterase
MNETTKDIVRVAAIGDLHCPRTPVAQLQMLLSQANDSADVLLLCGDLTDRGRKEEAEILAKVCANARIPVLAVLGNHDYECGQADLVTRILCDAGVEILDGESRIVHGIGFVGVKGFAGGFGDRALQPWGEVALKAFVREAVDEAVKLESALAKLQVSQRIAFLHYAPIAETVQGEPPEILAFLGSSRLEDPLNRYPVVAAFHGHAHQGTAEGKTKDGIPVYNVALPVLQRTYPDRPAFRLLEVPAGVPERSPA